MRVLVIPASKYGGTAEIGRAIARTLRGRGIDVDVSQPEHMFDLSPYAAHIVGSGLYLGKWLPQAETFVEEYQDGLRRKPTWLFSSGPLGEARPDIPIADDVISLLMERTGANEHRLFSGRLDLKKLTRTERFIARWVGAKSDDYREWDEITAWAGRIADALEGHKTTNQPPTAPQRRTDPRSATGPTRAAYLARVLLWCLAARS